MHPCRSLSRIRSDRRIFKDGTYLGDSPQGNPTHISGPGDLEHKQTRLREGLENFGVFSRRCPTGCKVAEESNCRCADFIHFPGWLADRFDVAVGARRGNNYGAWPRHLSPTVLEMSVHAI